jgi:hypothetical protein
VRGEREREREKEREVEKEGAAVRTKRCLRSSLLAAAAENLIELNARLRLRLRLHKSACMEAVGYV